MLFRLPWFQSLGPLTVAGPAAHTQAAWTAMLPTFLPSSGSTHRHGWQNLFSLLMAVTSPTMPPVCGKIMSPITKIELVVFWLIIIFFLLLSYFLSLSRINLPCALSTVAHFLCPCTGAHFLCPSDYSSSSASCLGAPSVKLG